MLTVSIHQPLALFTPGPVRAAAALRAPAGVTQLFPLSVAFGTSVQPPKVGSTGATLFLYFACCRAMEHHDDAGNSSMSLMG